MNMPFSEWTVCCYLYTISRYGYPPPAENTLRYIEEMNQMGFVSIELEGIRKHHLNQVYDYRHDIREMIDKRGMRIPYFCAVLPGISSPEKSDCEENLKLFEKGCEVAGILGSSGILDNAPLPPYHFPEDIPVVRHYDEDALLSATIPPDLDWKTYWDQLIGTYREACDTAAGYGLTVQLHPCLGVLVSSADAFLYFADAVKRDNLRFNLDTANQFMMKDNLPLALLRLKDRIDYIHLSDNRGYKVEHLPPGEGKINWEMFFETLERIGFKGHIGLDIGGEENPPDQLNLIYVEAAQWLESMRLKGA